MKKAIFLSIFLPFLTFAANSVSIDSITASSNGTATASGQSVYDTSTKTDGTFDSNATQSSTDTSWSFTQTGLKAGTHSFQAVVGGVSAVQSFDVHSSEGGLRGCQLDGSCPTYGLLSPQIPDQKNPVSKSTNNRAKDGTLVTIHNLFDLLRAGLI